MFELPDTPRSSNPFPDTAIAYFEADTASTGLNPGHPGKLTGGDIRGGRFAVCDSAYDQVKDFLRASSMRSGSCLLEQRHYKAQRILAGLALSGLGLEKPEIARTLNVTRSVIPRDMNQLNQYLQTNDRVAAIAACFKNGFFEVITGTIVDYSGLTLNERSRLQDLSEGISPLARAEQTTYTPERWTRQQRSLCSATYAACKKIGMLNVSSAAMLMQLATDQPRHREPAIYYQGNTFSHAKVVAGNFKGGQFLNKLPDTLDNTEQSALVLMGLGLTARQASGLLQRTTEQYKTALAAAKQKLGLHGERSVTAISHCFEAGYFVTARPAEQPGWPTPKQQTAWQQLARGASLKESARASSVRVNTIATHRQGLAHTLGTHNDAAAATYYWLLNTATKQLPRSTIDLSSSGLQNLHLLKLRPSRS